MYLKIFFHFFFHFLDVNFSQMNIDFRSIVIYLHKKGLTPYEIQSEIDSVFGEGTCIVLRIRPEGAVKIS